MFGRLRRAGPRRPRRPLHVLRSAAGHQRRPRREGSRPGRRRQRPGPAPPPERGRVPHRGRADRHRPGGGRDRLRRGFLGAAAGRGVADGGPDRDGAARRGRPAGRRPGRGVADGGQRRRPGAGRAAGADGAPAATYVSAVVSQELMTICWLGDSRAYWLRPRGWPQRAERHDRHHRRVQADHQGRLAGRGDGHGRPGVDGRRDGSPQAHVITRWLGADLPDPLAHIEQFTDRPGVLLVCSDGLWNYRQEAAELAAMAMPAALQPRSTPPPTSSSSPSTRGASKLTVVLIPFPPR